MNKFNSINSLKDIYIIEIMKFCNTKDLEFLLLLEDYTDEVDIMLENMLDYFLEYEYYEYAVVIRDEIKRRDIYYKSIKN